MEKNVLIIGAGQAATQAVASLRQFGYGGNITILGDEGVAPYQRPPLSKAYLMGDIGLSRLQFRGEDQWTKDGVELRVSDPAIRIDRHAKTVETKSGIKIGYDKLIIATGSRVREISCEGSSLKGINYLRTLGQSDKLKADMEGAKSITIIGAGYIGLEVAAIARKKGLEVNVIELAPRVLARVATPVISEYFEDLHAKYGVNIITNSGVKAFVGKDKVQKVLLDDGREIAADVVLVGIGIIPNSEIASETGVICNNGIDVDNNALTNDKDIYACGDCCNRHLELYDINMRLESVHNAIEQAKLAAAHIVGVEPPKLDTPWFWSDQYDIKLQIAGISNGASQHVIRGNPGEDKFAVFHLNDENRVLAIDAVNSPGEFLIGKKLVMARAIIAPHLISDSEISMKELAANAVE
jgi:3-phenylpropionate/trans-cinnamate dioxygenase ferredoxin reductase subunit